MRLGDGGGPRLGSHVQSGPSWALANYQRRGFRVFQEVVHSEDLPAVARTVAGRTSQPLGLKSWDKVKLLVGFPQPGVPVDGCGCQRV